MKFAHILYAALCLGLGTFTYAADVPRSGASAPQPQVQTQTQTAVAISPDKFMRRWDPVTFFFDTPTGPQQPGPEHQAQRFVSMNPVQPGVYTWLNAKTLQFRPSEPWPALSRFSFKTKQSTFSLITLMEAPTQTIPADREEGLQPVERITLTFAEPLDPEALRQMLRIGLRPLPGIDESQTRWLDQKDFDLKVIERVQRRDPASYVLSFTRPIASGQRVIVRLRLSLEDSVGETFKDISFTTLESFHITRFGCASLQLPVTPEGVRYARDQALHCNADQRRVQVEFSAPPKTLSPIEARNLVRFTPAVEGLTFRTSGRKLMIDGNFQADTLYQASLMPIGLSDTRGRALLTKAASELFLHFPAKPKYLKWQVGHGIVERFGPQQMPVEGRGFGRVDLRIYPIDPLNRSFWPFPEQPVETDEQAAPPAPGEGPKPFGDVQRNIETQELVRQLRTLGSPPVSTIVKLPLRTTSSAAGFGIDLEPHVTAIAGRQQPGTYLVGLRKIDESTQRSWVRVQVTDLSLSTIEEEAGVKFAVTSLSTGAPVGSARVRVEGQRRNEWVVLFEGGTGPDGTVYWQPSGNPGDAGNILRIVVSQGRDVLVLNPRRAPDRYADNHWSGPGGTWLQWTQGSLAARRPNAHMLCHVFTERPVYRPEEKVYVKGYVRKRLRGAIALADGSGTLVVDGPGGLTWRYPVKLSAAGSFDMVFDEANSPTGNYTLHFEHHNQPQPKCGAVTVLKEAYRAPEFELRLNASEKVPLDRAFKVQLVAQYYAGGQAAGRPVRWRVTQFPYAWTPNARPGFFYSSDGRFSGRERFQSSPVLEREEQTDAQGGSSITINPALETTGQPRSYVFEATVTGADDQTVSATQRVLALPAIVLGIKTPRYFERAKSVSPEIIVVGPDGNLVAQQDVVVRLIKREWHSHLQASDFSQGAAKYVTDVVDKKITERQVKSGTQPLRVELPLDGAGVYVVELEAHDKLGRAQTVAVDLYAGGDEPVTWARPSSDVFQAMPDKTAYAPGDTAHLVLQSPFQQAQGLAVIEAPDGNRYQWFTVKNGAATVDVPIQKNFVPRLPVHLVLMRGRVPGVPVQAGSRLDLGKPATVAATSWLKVEPVEHQVNVALENPARARPGETVKVKISLSDRARKPASGEATLWLVDQAVLALGKEQRLDPIPDFITPVQSRTTVQDTRNWTLGVLPWNEQPGGDKAAKEADEDLLDKVTVRREFKTVPYYNPAIEIGPNGTTTVSVQLPDNLTNFKLRAKVASGPDRFGVGVGQVAVRMPLIVQPALPRFVRPGDRFTAAAIGRVVEGEGGAAQAELRVKGVELAGESRRSMQLKANEPQRIEYQVTVPTPATSSLSPTSPKGEAASDKVGFTFGLERSSDKARDAFDVQLPVRADRTLLTQRRLLEIKPGESAEVAAITEAARSGSIRRTLLASDQVALVRMAAGLNFLLAYPHHCTEQRVSRAWAFLALKEFNDRLYRDGQDKELKRVVQDVLVWLPGVIDSNGLVSYWPGSAGYVSLTAWVTEFLVEARKAGFSVEQAIVDRLVASLQQALRSDYTHFISGESYTERVMALRALAAAGRLDTAYLAELARRTEYLNLESSAQVLRLLNASGDKAPATRQALNKKVWDGVVLRLFQGREVYGGLQEGGASRNGLVLPSETRTLAEVVRATAAAPTADPRLALLVDALVTLGQDDGWGSTQANAAALLALSDVLKGQSKASGTEVQRLKVHDGTQTHTLEIGAATPLVSLSGNSAGKLVLQSEGSKPLIARVETSYLPQELGSQAPANASGFVVNRELLHQSAGGGTPERQHLAQPGTLVKLHVGDVVEDHVEVVTNANHTHVAVTVPLAAGLEPLNPKLATAPPEATPTGSLTREPSYAAYLDDQVVYYYDQLPKGAYHFYSRTRATVAGRFTQPQARAELMYDAAVHGASVGATVEVRAKAP
ncbi:MAG: alpha-2-macroglobulin [Rhodoferax sp.]|nr:alpha-2-macroglobulin [Rhodoferax sp.]